VKALFVVLAATLIAVAAIAAFAPASLVDARLSAATGGAVRLAETDGTLWQGRGVLGAPDGRWRVPVAWTLDVAPLLRGVASLAFGSAETADIRGSATALRDRIVIDSLDATLPGAMLAVFDPAAAVATGGEVKVRATTLDLGPAPGPGTINADWSNARMRIGGLLLDLGTVTLRLSAQGGSLGGPVSSQGGDVSVDGNMTLREGRLDAQLRLTPSASASPELRNALASLGAADVQGAVALRVGRTLR
jgi:hypothetical protein